MSEKQLRAVSQVLSVESLGDEVGRGRVQGYKHCCVLFKCLAKGYHFLLWLYLSYQIHVPHIKWCDRIFSWLSPLLLDFGGCNSLIGWVVGAIDVANHSTSATIYTMFLAWTKIGRQSLYILHIHDMCVYIYMYIYIYVCIYIHHTYYTPVVHHISQTCHLPMEFCWTLKGPHLQQEA